MGKQESPTPIDDQIDSSNEMVKGSNVEEDDTVSVDPSPIEPQPDSQPKVNSHFHAKSIFFIQVCRRKKVLIEHDS